MKQRARLAPFGTERGGAACGQAVAIKEFFVPTQAVGYDPGVYQRREIAVLKQVRIRPGLRARW